MKVIDLYNKIANGEEVPEKIQVYNDIFIFDYSNMVYESERTRTNLLSIYNGYILNYEVAIIEEPKKIEKIEMCTGGIMSFDSVENITTELKNKINELIDKINKMEEK